MSAPTSSSSEGRSSPEHDWVTAYEDLRQAALEEPDGHVRRAPGFALLLRAGIAAWMQACRSVAVPALSARPPSRETTRALPGTVRAEVTVLLAEMALAAAEVAR